MPHFATEFTLPLLSGLVVFPALLKVCLLRAVFADVSSLPTMKTFTLLSSPLSTILGYVPLRTTKIAFPFFSFPYYYCYDPFLFDYYSSSYSGALPLVGSRGGRGVKASAAGE